MEKIAPVVFPSPAVPPKEEIIISKATTDKEKREIYRLRYQIYAEEIAFKLAAADHANKFLQDELDEKAMLFYAKVGSKIIGTGRINIGKLSDFPPDLVETYRMDRFRKFYDKKVDPYFAVISKGMVVPQYRSSPAFYLLMAEGYKLCCDYQIQFSFVNCNFHLIPLHEHYGSRRIDKNIIDPNIGPMASLVMLVDDVQHLQTVRSPFFRIARKRTSLKQEVVNWFNSEFACEIRTTVNSQLIAVDELWSIICHYLGDMPHHIIPILEELSILEAKLFLHCCGSIVHCHTGDFITAGGNASQELNVLLSGKVEKVESYSAERISLGQHFGESGLVKRTIHSSSYIAIDDSDILVLSFHYFSNFRKRHPNIARKILNNLHKQNYSLYVIG
ncbi:MAG TPA: cyclic nucleotide-binding domain-containing protein [Methylomusa anaerophila]|uniref:Cyclic nucleotide-binding domain protein n=1 Tax=Methylomusa anaerophila TaxID=1930071 RepID=A0A348ANN1_9FIRM|nr:cyclic nucleotide-binding domain-containing protein [Methylomusa anaerophila]BBB92679.1 cyclic nucleotide-binding domain protein [Methylomusa anaerophila]HML87468.1 cyclic nucleotide-binding domain-containing protein [Methylomusa anaerophila]